jgi:hypothetical protein
MRPLSGTGQVESMALHGRTPIVKRDRVEPGDHMMRRWLKLLLAGTLAVAGVGLLPAPAYADCDARLFAVDSTSGHLVEIPMCSGFGTPREANTEDWRTYTSVFAVRENAMVALYTVSPAGELWWRRQDVPGGALGAPVRVGASVNWHRQAVFAPYPGYVIVSGGSATVEVYRHQGWATGDPDVSTAPPLFSRSSGLPITGMASGFAVGVWGIWVYRIARTAEPSPGGYDEFWTRKGILPTGVTGVVNDTHSLYGLSASGEVVSIWAQSQCECDPLTANGQRTWTVTGTVPGQYSRVILPLTTGSGALPQVNPPPCAVRPLPDECRLDLGESPWEWQEPPAS